MTNSPSPAGGIPRDRVPVRVNPITHIDATEVTFAGWAHDQIILAISAGNERRPLQSFAVGDVVLLTDDWTVLSIDWEVVATYPSGGDQRVAAVLERLPARPEMDPRRQSHSPYPPGPEYSSMMSGRG